ncbi:unnamed protein product [Gulo gulo]|uniref:Uncharacterized protein n=1 Tax=Gulo gulo TaxID=48420 RepID=A0A9X9PV98_GULGU|nr:unnamed protein product [Gulo gulo]
MAGYALSVWVGMVADKSPEVRAAGRKCQQSESCVSQTQAVRELGMS